MSKPGKSASRPLMSIEETIHRRLSVNIEFVYHVACVGRESYSYPIQHCINVQNAFLKIDWGQQYAHAHISKYMEQNNIRGNIKKYVGEFY
jgi:hypothetical protein